MNARQSRTTKTGADTKASLGIVQMNATQFDGPFFRYLAKRGTVDLTVYYTRQYGDTQSVDEELQSVIGWANDVISGYRYFLRPAGFMGFFRLLKTILKSHHDLVIIAGYYPAGHLLIVLLCRLRGKAVGLRSDSILLYGKPTGFRGIVKSLLLPRILGLYRTGHPTGTLAAEYLLHYGMPKEQLFMFPYNVDNDWLTQQTVNAESSCEELRKQLGIPTEAPVILGILKFVPREDPMTLLLAFARLKGSRPQSHLVLVGDGPLRGQMEDYISQNSLSGVHFLGYQPYPSLPGYYRMATVFVHPAVREQWGVSVNEAMVCGVPVVTSSAVGAARDLIQPEESGFVFPVGDSAALATVLDKLIDSIELRTKLAQGGRKIMEKWNYAQTAENLEAALLFVNGGE